MSKPVEALPAHSAGEQSSVALRERLREVLNHVYPGSLLHELLAAVPAPMVIVVTNYDTLVEQAFRAAGKPYDLVVYGGPDGLEVDHLGNIFGAGREAVFVIVADGTHLGTIPMG